MNARLIMGIFYIHARGITVCNENVDIYHIQFVIIFKVVRVHCASDDVCAFDAYDYSQVWNNISTTLSGTKWRVTKLMEGKEYIFRTAAENKLGLGPWFESASYVARMPFGG